MARFVTAFSLDMTVLNEIENRRGDTSRSEFVERQLSYAFGLELQPRKKRESRPKLKTSGVGNVKGCEH